MKRSVTIMPKRGENIWKRKDGRWEARFSTGKMENGKTSYGYVYAKSYAEVKAKRELKVDEFRKSSTSSLYLHNIRFDDLLDNFMKRQRYRVKESTYAHYYEMIETHIKPFFGKRAIEQLDNSFIDQFVDEKLNHGRLDGKGGLSTKTVKDLTVLLKHILSYAVEIKCFPEGALLVNIPKSEKPNIEILTTVEQQKLEVITKNAESNYLFGIYICLYTGLRIGEICALRWCDVNFEKNTLSVCRTIQRVKNTDKNAKSKTKILIDRPKTDSSIRTIPLPAFIMCELSNHKEDNSSQFDYVLTGNNKYIEPRNYYQRYKSVIKQCGIADYTFHALRHTFATRAIECGFDVKSLSEILGHADVKITLERYVHPSIDLKRGYMEQLVSFC